MQDCKKRPLVGVRCFDPAVFVRYSCGIRYSIVFTIVFASPANLPIGNSIVFAPLALLRFVMASETLNSPIIKVIQLQTSAEVKILRYEMSQDKTPRPNPIPCERCATVYTSCLIL